MLHITFDDASCLLFECLVGIYIYIYIYFLSLYNEIVYSLLNDIELPSSSITTLSITLVDEYIKYVAYLYVDN